MIKIAVCDHEDSISQSIKQMIEKHMARQDVEVDALAGGQELFLVLDKAVSRVKDWENNFFFFKHKGIGHKKNLKDIVYFCSSYPCVEVVCLRERGKFHGKIDSIEKELATLSKDFVRPSKNYLVNRKYISNYSPSEVIMINGERISVTRKYRQGFLTALNDRA